jgi:nitrite reductase/ring-hydroxylating ferredoxin subunit
MSMAIATPSQRPLEELGRSELEALIVPADGQVSRRFITDPDLYRLELERIFARCWLFVAHASEIPQVGNFVTRHLGEDPVIVIRAEDGRVRVLLNSCRHRGTMLTQVDAGTANHFICPYHGWTYRSTGELSGVPLYQEAWSAVLDRSKYGLLETPQVAEYRDLIFATWDPRAPSLEEFLGGMKWYLDLMLARTDEGLEVIGPPQRWMVDVNWKVPAGSFAGDSYHLLTLHGLLFGRGSGRIWPGDGYQIHTENGHGIGLNLPGSAEPVEPFCLQPEELLEELPHQLSQQQLDVLRPVRNTHGNIFPNLSFFDTSLRLGSNQPFLSFLSLRQLQPRGSDRLEFLAWCLLPKAAAAWRKQATRQLYVSGFGPAGTIEQDDTAAWRRITEGNRGVMARRLTLHYGMGLGSQQPVDGWPGPGTAYPSDMSEANERAFVAYWLDLMSRP